MVGVRAVSSVRGWSDEGIRGSRSSPRADASAEPAEQLGDRKVANLLETRASAVVSANPGCLLQLMSGLRRRGEKAMPAFHMVELLDASIRGLGTEDLLREGTARVQ